MYRQNYSLIKNGFLLIIFNFTEQRIFRGARELFANLCSLLENNTPKTNIFQFFIDFRMDSMKETSLELVLRQDYIGYFDRTSFFLIFFPFVCYWNLCSIFIYKERISKKQKPSSSNSSHQSALECELGITNKYIISIKIIFVYRASVRSKMSAGMRTLAKSHVYQLFLH